MAKNGKSPLTRATSRAKATKATSKAPSSRRPAGRKAKPGKSPARDTAKTAAKRSAKPGKKTGKAQGATTVTASAGAATKSRPKSKAVVAGATAQPPRRPTASARAVASPAKSANGAKAKSAAGSKSAAGQKASPQINIVAASARRTANSGLAAHAVRERTAAVKSDPKKSEIVLSADYKPSDSEPFMSERQRIYFRNKLLAWKDDILRQNRETLQGLHEDTSQHADLADRATSETDKALELRARDRQRKLVAKIDAALARIEEGTYGYCEETGEPISLKRLDARPIATLSLEAQERHERRERVFRDE